jgi:hypothetical protein
MNMNDPQTFNTNFNNSMQQDDLFKASLNTGPRGGIPIKNLKNNCQNLNQTYNPNSNQNNNFNTIYNQNPNPDQNSNQNFNQNPNSNPNSNSNQNSNLNQNQQKNNDDNLSIISKNSNLSQTQSKIKKITSCINNKLLDDDKSSDSDSSYESATSIKKNKSLYQNDIFNDGKPYSIKNKILEYSKEIILIVIIYIVLSQDFLKKKIAVHLPQIINGNLQGTIIYGTLHAILYVIFKSLLKA